MQKLSCWSLRGNLNCFLLYRHQSTLSTATSTAPKKTVLLAENLLNRSLLRLHGKDVLPVLQYLVTNDVTKLQKGFQSLYAMFLKKNGKVMADAILYSTADKNTFLLECDRNLKNELKRRMRMQKQRGGDLDIESLSGDFRVWAVFNDVNSGKTYDPLGFAHYKNGGSIGLKVKTELSPAKLEEVNEEILLCRDPRGRNLGARVIVPHDFGMKDISRLFPHCFLESPDGKNDYKRLRYSLGIGEGIDDHVPGKLLPIESNCDFMNGFCFKKSGFIGQDVTSQSYHINIKRRIMPLLINGHIDFNNLNVHLPNGKHIGKLLGRKGRNGLAILRVEDAVKALRLMIDGVPCELRKPAWWPANALTLRKDIPRQEESTQESFTRAIN